jgi:hypothetical protein
MLSKRLLTTASIALLLGVSAFSMQGCNYAHETGSVIRREVAPAVLQKRYNDFKDILASLDSIKADIEAYQSKLKSIKEEQVNASGDAIPLSQWPQDIRFDYSQTKNELLGKIQAYNLLAARYNADMAKAQYAFTNVGQLPQGASEPLPREVRAYVTTIK